MNCGDYVEMCSFEDAKQPLCSWTHDSDADFRWRRVRGNDVSNSNWWYDYYWSGYEPDRDHTSGKTQKLS